MQSIHRTFQAPVEVIAELDRQAGLHTKQRQSQWISDWMEAACSAPVTRKKWTNQVEEKAALPTSTTSIRVRPEIVSLLIRLRCELCAAFDYEKDFSLRHAFLYLFYAGTPNWRDYFKGRGR